MYRACLLATIRISSANSIYIQIRNKTNAEIFFGITFEMFNNNDPKVSVLFTNKHLGGFVVFFVFSSFVFPSVRCPGIGFILNGLRPEDFKTRMYIFTKSVRNLLKMKINPSRYTFYNSTVESNQTMSN